MDDCNDSLKSLKIYIMYDLYNNPENVGSQNEKCDDLQEQLSKYPNFKNLCYKISKNLIGTCTSLNNSDKNTGSCVYLNYWLYDLLIKNKMLDNSDNISASEVIQKLPYLWTETNYNGKCELTQYNISTSDFNLMKILYDYSFNYLTIDEIKDNPYYSECKRHYCTYINIINHFYNTAEAECDTKPEKAYCDKFNEVKSKKDPNKLFLSLKCTKDDVHGKLIHVQEFISKELLSFLPQTAGYIFADESPIEGNSNVSAKIGFSLFVICVISFFLLYKFTPMGDILRTIIRSKLNSSSFLREKLKLQLLKHNEEFENEKSQNNEHNISYLPFGNG
ncbi:PIR Superfamily Protein [Plasmodium ovale curtisi]|uniref:PIR Superfamily Protein n=1 Tax=Plasmodium ovale curtisi TaxID=864141 RepID=A0A1A8X4P4_PLAOA|nr:PIR Superfamily Protein [Plasmodium ovale curtisi]